MTPKHQGSIGLAVGLVLALLSTACGDEPAREEVLRPVRTETVVSRGGTRMRTFAGTARAGRETELSFRVPGTVERMPVKVGEAVRSGQTIARLERRDYDIAVRQAEAGLAQAAAAQRSAESDLERVRGLWETDNASQSQLDAALAKAQSASAQSDGARETLEAARRRLEYTTLKSPVDGAVAAVFVEENENVGQGQKVVLLAAGSRPEVEVAIPEVLISQIREGDDVTVTLDALPGAELDAVVTEVGVASTGTATTFPVTVRMRRDNRDVRSGMAAEVRFRIASGETEGRIFLPSHAVAADLEGRFVFVLEPTGEGGVGVVRRTPVEVGRLTADGLEVASGLSEGQRVVTAGVSRLTDGQRVRLLDEEDSE